MFIAMNRFKIKTEFSDMFETHWKTRNRFLDQSPGYIRFRLLRAKLPNSLEVEEFVSYTEWVDEECFLEWMIGPNSKRAHSGQESKFPHEGYMGPPEFKGYNIKLEETLGHRTDFRSPYLDQISEKYFCKELPEQQQIPKKCQELGLPPINIGPFEGRLIELWLKSAKCKKGVEVGTLGGYSTTWLARGLGQGGVIYSLELDPKRAALAQENVAFTKALGVEIQVIAGKASDSLLKLKSQGPFDFVFIDADKAGYPAYTEWAIDNLRSGGLILCDNAYIWGGMNYYPKAPESLKYPKSQESLFSYSKNEYKGMSECWNLLCQSPLLDSLILPTGEGLGIAIKR
jgi:predicted O-methyltransferase YrrM/heme-degrading monooxygenase HmoA